MLRWGQCYDWCEVRRAENSVRHTQSKDSLRPLLRSWTSSCCSTCYGGRSQSDEFVQSLQTVVCAPHNVVPNKTDTYLTRGSFGGKNDVFLKRGMNIYYTWKMARQYLHVKMTRITRHDTPCPNYVWSQVIIHVKLTSFEARVSKHVLTMWKTRCSIECKISLKHTSLRDVKMTCFISVFSLTNKRRGIKASISRVFMCRFPRAILHVKYTRIISRFEKHVKYT